MKKNQTFLDTQPDVLVAEISKVIRETIPSKQYIMDVKRGLLRRHIELGLVERVLPEEVVEGYFRCILTNHIQQRFNLETGEIPTCINSSHTATRVACIAALQHKHLYIQDAKWRNAWRLFQKQHPEVNIEIPGSKNPRRADLYFAVQGGIVSVEFKYLGIDRSLNIKDCVEQMDRYVKKHATTMLVVYIERVEGREIKKLDRLRHQLDPAVNVILVQGPIIKRDSIGLGKALKFFLGQGLAFPKVPDELASQLKESGNWSFSTRVIDWDNYMSPYNLDYYVEEFENNHVEDYTILCHSGHGVNSYAIQYYLVYGRLGLFLHLGWGGWYMDEVEERAKISKCFSLADQIVLAVKKVENLGGKDQLLVVGSDFYGSYWLPPGMKRQDRFKVSENPTEVLTEVLNWVKFN